MKSHPKGNYYLVKDITESVRQIKLKDPDSLTLAEQIILYNLQNPDKIK